MAGTSGAGGEVAGTSGAARAARPKPQYDINPVMLDRTAWSTWRPQRHRALTLALLLELSGCMNGVARLDATAKRESMDCPIPPTRQTMIPPPGEYEDQGIRLEYDRLAPRPDPRKNVDMGYSREAVEDPRRLEQLYYDATSGNPRAAWFLCQFEVGVRNLGRAAARHLASLQCQTIHRCSVELEKLPFSQETASGRRVLTVVGDEFEAEAMRQRIEQSLISDALMLFVGIKVATGLRPHLRMPEHNATRAKTFSNKFPEHAVGPPLQEFSIQQVKRVNFTRKLNYVVLENGSLRLGRIAARQVGGGHIDLAGGRNVLAAGEVKIVRGQIVYIDNASGHYLPHGSSAQRAAEGAFQQAGFDAAGKYVDKVYRDGRWVPLQGGRR